MKSPKKSSVVSRPDRRPLNWSVDLSLAVLTKGKRIWSKRGADKSVTTTGPATWLTNL
ncbi:MAG TPA: hypothetical protein VK815_12950 [Candidatus Acidoferrales bacterium]|jgi:hypothetical protein|nr:hypothetical protein [Candidatus Acidoferrales bacterium]